MSHKNTFVKKLTALVLCLCMVLPMVTTGFAPMMALLDTLAPQAEAAVTEKGKVAFYVPEVIYLYPNATSWRDTTSTPFQFYVENTVNTSSIYSQPTPNTELKTTGTIYFAAESGFSNVSIATRFCDASGNTISGGSVTTGAFSNKTTYGTFSVTEGTSPSFSTSTTGCYIEWTVTYTNNAGERQSAIAYSYVYKPYTVPYGGVVWVQNTSYINSEARQITWVSGVHSVAACTETLDGAPYPRFGNNGTRSMAAFLSSQPTGYVGSTKVTGTLSQVLLSNAAISEKNALSKDMYAVFATTNPSTSYFYAMQSGSTWSNEDCWNWFTNDYSASGTYNIRSFNHWWKDNNKANVISYLTSTAVGSMYIDTSRYSNLAEIPNLGVGLMVTNDESSDEGSWYVADVTGTTNRGSKSYEGSDNRSKFYNDKNIVMARAGGASEGDMHAGSGYEVEERKYTGTWVRPLDKSVGQKTYTVKGYYGNHDGGDHALTHVLIDLKAIQSDKSTLRTAVNNAIQAMGTIGLKDNYGSYYYDTNSAAWTAFKTAYRNACVGLTKLDGSCDVSGLASALNTAVANLKAGQGRKIYFNVNYGNINPNYYILGNVTNGGYGLTATYNADESVTINGTISGSNAFGSTPFTPTVGSYTFSATLLSGSKNGNGCVVLDSSKDDTNNISTRSNFDFTGNAQKTITYNNTMAQETDLLRFWQWKNTENDVYSNLTARIKVEKGSAKTAYSPAGRIATSSGTYGTLPTPDARTGYIFGGWYADAACTTKINDNAAVSVDMLYAKWTPITYKIVYNANGNNVSGTMNEQVLTYDKAANLTGNAFARTGYTWLNWNTETNGSGTTYTDGQSVLNLASVQDTVINLYAQWKAHTYTIKFNANGGEGSMADMAMTYDVAKNLTANTFTKPGYTFAGWTTLANGTGQSYADGQSVNNLTATDGGEITLYANWSANKQTLTVDSNGGVNGGNLLYNPNGLTSWREGDDSYVSADITIDENGVDISGKYTGGASERVEMLDLWVYLEDGKTYEYSFTSDNTISEFYLFPNGEIGKHANIKTRVGTEYRGVFTCGEAGGNIGESSWTGLANATAHYQIRLDQNCGENGATGVNSYSISNFVIREVTPDAANVYKQPTDTTVWLPDPTRGGYTFNGWTGLTNGTLANGVYTFGAGADTLVANWTPLNYTLTLDADGGTFSYNGGTVGSADVAYTPDSTYTLPEPVRAGYEFAGWKITVADGSWQADGICQVGDPLTSMYGNVTLTAMWAPLEVDYKVEHWQMNLDGSTYALQETENKTGETDTAAVFAAKSYEGFTYSHAEVNGTTVTSATIAGDGSLVVKLYYTRNQYTVTAKAGTGIDSVTGSGKYYYGATVALNAVVKAGYTWTNWTKDGSTTADTKQQLSFPMGAENVAWTANAAPQQVKYTVEHKYQTLNGGYETITEELTAQVDTDVTPAFVNKDGFTAEGNTQTVTVKGDGSTVVTYTYKRNTYTFTTNVDGATTPVEYKYGAPVTAPTAPTKTGYTFAGWDGTIPDTMPAYDVTVTATWTINSYTVTYKVNGEVVKTETYEYAADITPYVYTKTGYNVSAWTGETHTTMPAKNLEYTATATVIEYSITYDLQGGSLADGATNPGKYTVESAQITLNNPTKQGYTFAGWTGTGLTSATNPVIIPAGSTENRSYTANWTPAQNTYTVETYTMDTAGNYGEAVKTTGSGLTSKTATVTPETKEGFTVDASSVLSGTIAADGSLVLKVYYRRNQYTLTVNAGTGVSTVSGGGSYYYGALLNMTATLKDGYQTVVWSDGSATYTPGTSTMPDKALTLTATASPIGYTVSYDLAGGTVSGTNPTSYNVESDSFTLVNPTRNGYTFAGWTGTGLDAASTSVTVAKGSTGNRAYTATWTPVTYTIIYNYNDGTVATENPSTYTIETDTFTLVNPTKQGYAFAGWTGTGISGTADSVSIAKGSTGDRAYTATWTESDANYTVKHYRQNLDGTYSTLLETEVISSTTGKTVTAAVKSYDGFTSPEAVEVTVLADGSATVEYRYTRNSYKIVYYTVNADDAQIEFETLEALYEAPVTAVTEVPTRTGYEFTKWDVACPATMPLNGLEITALWNPSTFDITYEGIYDEQEYPKTHTFDTETDISVIPTRDGYTFAGWEFNGNPITFENNKIGKRQFSDDFTLTATWTANPVKYTVETYLMGTDGQYPQTATSFVQKDTVTDAEITATHETMTGFTADADKSIVKIDHAAFDGTSVLKLYYSRNQYALTLEKGTGVAEVTGAQNYYYQQSVTVNASMLAGYDWAKWTKGDADFATAQNHTFQMPAEALTLKANATVHTYNISIDLKNGAFADGYTAPTSYTVTDENISIPDPTRTGYIFNGWLVNGASAPQKNYTIDTANAVDVNLVADWTAIEYKITYVLAGGVNAESNPDTYTIESPAITLAEPTKTGYEFIKWTEGDTIAAGSTGDKTFTAEWKALGVEYIIVSHFEGFTAGIFDTFVNGKGSADADGTVQITDIAVAQTGFTFKEAKLTEGGEVVTEFKNGTTDGAVTVHLYYTRNSYTVTFDTDGGDAVEAQTYKYDAEVTLPATLNKTGYTFAGWDKEITSMPAENVTVKAQWTINQYTVTFANTGDSTIEPITADYGTAIDKPADPTKTGYTFAGWDKEIPATMPAENVTVTAQWTINQYTVTFDTDGGTEIAPITQDFGTEITKPADPTKEGYTFKGWDTEIPEKMPAENVTVKAQWTINQYTLTFAETGDSTIDAITADYGTVIDKPADPTKVGYTFTGWDVEIPDTMPAKDMTITATWKINQYTVTFDSDGGSAVSAITQDYNTAITAPSDPTRAGYTFAGWTPAVPTVMPAENVTVKAQWTIVNYNISYELNGGVNAATNPKTYTVEDEVNLAAPTKVGYTFAGWSDNGIIGKGSTGDKTFTASWTPNQNTPITVNYYIQPVKVNAEQSEYTLYSTDSTQVGTSDADREVTPIEIAGFKTPDKQTKKVNADGTTVFDFYYTRNEYTVTFDTDGGSAIGSITALYEADITAPTAPTKTGYTFDGWTPALEAKMPLGGQTVKAVWTANSYKVSYDYNVPENVTVTHSGNVPEAHTYGTATPVSDPERAGYTFAGWIINDSGAAVKALTLAADGYTADITLKATWTADEQNYTVIYFYEALDGAYVETNRTTDNKAVTDSTVTLTPAATQTGFTLNTKKSVLTGVVPVPGTTLELSVYYDRNEYTVTWDVEGVTTTEDYKYEQPIVKPADPVKTGYNFLAWNPEVPEKMPAEDKTFKAQFAADTDTAYKVIHKLEDLNADTYTVKETENLTGTTATEVTPEVNTYEGFTSPTTQTVIIAADGSTVVEYLYTRNSYEVTIVATDAGLSNATASQTVEFEDTLGVSVAVADGYQFLGWTSDNEKVAGSDVAVYTITVPASDVTLTAKTALIKYTVSYELDGGALADGKTNPTEFYVTTEDFTLNNPEKTGYNFLGWTGSNGNTAETAVTVKKGTFTNLSYTANWELIPYAITYDLAGGSVATPNATQYYVTTATFTLNNPTRAGYTFKGWTGTGLDGAVETVTVTKGSTGARKYTATWEANDIATVVNYHWQNIDDNGYTLKDTVNGTVKNDTVFAPEVKTYEGFVSPAAQSVKVENGVAVTIDYYYDREIHTVSLSAGTGIDSVSGADAYRYGKQITVSAEVSKGYTWQNWTTSGTDAVVSADRAYTFTVGTADIALTANATLDTYTITYTDPQGVATTLDNPTSYNVHTEEIVLVNPEKVGYTFTGWTGTDLAGNTMEVKIEKGSVGNREYVANWNIITYTLTYDLAEGTLAEGESIPATYNVETKVELPTPTRVGYTFTGWSDGTDTAMNVVLDGATGDRHYTATWTANSNTKYTVNHYQMNLDGTYNETATATVEFFDGVSDGSVTPAVNTYEGFTSPDAQTVKVEPDGSTVVKYYYVRNQHTLTYVIAGSADVVNTYYYGATLPEAPTATRDGYTFSAWDITTPATMPANDLTVTALWNTVAYTVTFNENGGNAMADINYNIETAVTLPKAERVGYDFAGWTVAKTEGNWADSIAENNAVLSAGLWGNVTLTANWTARQDTPYVVKHMFMNVDGTAYVEDESKRVNATGTSDTPVTPEVLTVTGFTSPAAQEVTIAPDGSTVVEYKYKRNQYTVTWMIKGSADETVTYYYDAAVTAKAAPVLSGHTFTGWSREIPANMPAENITIVANFDIITYTITIDYNGGKEVANKTAYTVETDTFTLINPTRDGYTFTGWEGTDNGLTVTVEKGSTGDRTYKATWNADEQDWFVDVYYMTTEGKYNDTADESISNKNVTDTPVSFDSAAKLKDGFTFDAVNSSVSGTVPGTGTLRLIAKYSRNQYTVTYDFANGADKKVVKDYYESALESVADPTRTGYTFAGWQNSKGETVTLPTTMPLNGETYTAQWTADGYTLTLDENGGTAVEDINYTIEDTVTLPVLTKDGYFFQGWKVTTAGGAWALVDENYSAGTPVSGKYGTATLTAQWTTVQYTLTFDTTGGTVSEASLTYNIEEDKQLPTPVRPGYTFDGWKVTAVSNEANDSGNVSWVVGNVYDAGTTVRNTYGNATFEALWLPNTYTVTADAENITFNGANEATVDVDYTATLTPHAGYTLPDTITLTVGGKEAIVNTDYNYTVLADGTATLTVNGAAIIGDIAITVEREIITYTIAYDYANATVKPNNPTAYTVETETIKLIAPERTGYTFLGWTGSNGDTPETEVSVPVGSTGDKSYVANWKADPKQYTVEIYYMTTDGTYNTTPDKSWKVDSFTDEAVSYNIYSTETLLTGFTANEDISTLTGTVPGEGMLTLVAKYDRKQYTLTVNGCEGVTAATGEFTYYYDKEIVVDATVATGYTWVEWQSADETALAGSDDKKYIFNMPANDAELTAVATLDVYGITYDLAGGALAEGVTNPASYSVTTETFTLNNPTKVGYDFIGWTGTDLATPTVTVTVEKNSTTGAKSYTANWKAIEYTVSYDLDGGIAQGNNYTKYTIESEAQTLTAPAKLGYTFLGWTGSNGNTPETEVSVAGGTIGDLNFKANWSADSHYYTVEVRYMTTEGVYPNAADESEQILSQTDASVSVTPDAPEGFTFDPNGSILSGTVTPDDKLVLKVYYSRNRYELKLTDGGAGIDSVNTATNSVYYGASVEISAAVSNGYTFEKWTSADESVLAGSENNPYIFTMPASAVELTASATINRYNITYTLNGGTNDAANPTTYTVLDAVNIKQPTRLGYTFTGWSGSYYGKNVYIAAGNTGDINLTANWSINTYTVSYDLAGGTLADGQNNTTSYNVTESFTLYNPTKVGYDFVGWKGTGIDGTQENVTVAEGTTGDLAFTAVWTARPDTKYTVNYYLENVNGDQTYTLSADSFVGEYYSDQDITPAVPVYTGFATPVAQTKVVNADGTTVFNFYYERNIYTYTFKAIGYEDDVYKYYYEYPVAKPADPTRKGYTFEGWNPVVYATMPAFDVTAEAQWKAITYTVGYDLAGGTVSGNPTEYTVEQSFTLVNPTRVGYDFAGWTGTGLDEATLNVTVDAGSIGNRSYTATWTPVRYEITYDFAGGTDNGVNPISYTIEDSITLVNPTKVGYTFSGWKGTGIAGTSMVVSFRNSTGDRNYTASWRANNNTLYTVLHYQQDIGANTYSLFETEELYGTTLAEVSPNVKTYPGFTSPSRKTVTILPDGSATLEYYYTRNTYTIFFDSNGGTAVSSKTFAFGETLSGIETPSYLGYTFAGWTPALPETMTAGNLYVTADWKPNTDTPYTVYHYFQDVDCISYPDELMKVEYCYGETGAIVEVATWDTEGFTAPEKRSIVIAADGSRTVRYYYTRNTYTVTFVDHNDQILDMQSVVYGLPATPPALEDRAPDADGHYTFIGWSEDVSFIHGYTTIKAMYSSEAHNPGAEADCTNALVCTVCGYEIAPANGHMPVVQTPAKEPTCTEPGNTADSVCSVCGEVLSRYSILAPLGHEIGSWYVDVPATATTTGILKRACSRCDWHETHEIPVLSDTPVVSIDITTQGSQAYVGTSYQLVTEILPANAGNKQVIWESSDPSIATVTPEGFVTSHKPGEVTFTVITLDGLKTDSITINFYYAADHFNILLLDVFGCEVYLDGKMIDETVEFVRVKAGSTLAFTLKPTTDEYLEQGGYILTANGSNVKPDANGVYYIYNVHENIEISALPVIGKPEFDEDQNYDTDEVPEKSIFAKILEFFEKIAAFFRKLFGMD